MNIDFKPAKILLEMPNEVFVSFKNGVKIFLFVVGMGLSTPSYGHRGIVPPSLNGIQLEASDLEISLASVNKTECSQPIYQSAEDLFSSLKEHRIEMMEPSDIDGFWSVANEVTWLDFTDSMVCYEPEDKQITYDLLDKSGLVLHITQYLNNPKDQVVYSIEKDARFLLAGHTPIKDMGVKLKRAVNDLLKDNG